MSADAKDRAAQVHELLLDHYGRPALKEQRDPLSELVLTILSQNTADANTARAYASLKEAFPTWEQVLEADSQEVAAAIRHGGLANIKAPRIQAILESLVESHGRPTLEFLRDMPVTEAREYLTSLHGVGPKTAACVLLFSLHKPALPVDTHVHRVSLRVGLVPPKSSAEKTNLLLEAMLPPETYYPFHLNVIRLGRETCKASSPQCAQCPLVQICDYADARG